METGDLFALCSREASRLIETAQLREIVRLLQRAETSLTNLGPMTFGYCVLCSRKNRAASLVVMLTVFWSPFGTIGSVTLAKAPVTCPAASRS